jgi:hypothetical protein
MVPTKSQAFQNRTVDRSYHGLAQEKGKRCQNEGITLNVIENKLDKKLI